MLVCRCRYCSNRTQHAEPVDDLVAFRQLVRDRTGRAKLWLPGLSVPYGSELPRTAASAISELGWHTTQGSGLSSSAQRPVSPALMGSNGLDTGDDLDERGVSVREQDRFLPIANISRIMKKALPSNAKIAKDAKETVQECVSEFISFITSE